MSDYTVTLKRVADVYSKEQVLLWFKSYSLRDYLTIDQVTQISNMNVFDMNTLAEMIYNHYLFREIAYETPEMFKHFAITRLREIMGNYAPVIYSLSLDVEPLNQENLNIKETFYKNKQGFNNSNSAENISQVGESTGNTTGTSKTSGSSNSASYNTASSLNVASDTPQGQINKEDILNGKYASATSANESNSEIQDFTSSTSNNELKNNEVKNDSRSTASNGTNASNSNEYEEYERNKRGYDLRKTKSELVFEYRKNLMNVYQKIVEDMNPLFFALF